MAYRCIRLQSVCLSVTNVFCGEVIGTYVRQFHWCWSRLVRHFVFVRSVCKLSSGLFKMCYDRVTLIYYSIQFEYLVVSTLNAVFWHLTQAILTDVQRFCNHIKLLYVREHLSIFQISFCSVI